MAHIQLKPSKEQVVNFNPNELNAIDWPSESIEYSKDYLGSRKLAEEDERDIVLLFPDRIVYGFDYLDDSIKRVVVEINPVTIFFSNAVMCSGQLKCYKNLLLSQAPDVNEIGKGGEPFNASHAGMYFQLAINCIINLQAALESFANRIIPNDYSFIGTDGKVQVPNITLKLNNAIPSIKKVKFRQRKHKRFNVQIDSLIKLRNHIIHLKPDGQTNTGYKGVYRDLLNFDYFKAIESVRVFINFYEENLIEECLCGNDFAFFVGGVDK